MGVTKATRPLNQYCWKLFVDGNFRQKIYLPSATTETPRSWKCVERNAQIKENKFRTDRTIIKINPFLFQMANHRTWYVAGFVSVENCMWIPSVFASKVYCVYLNLQFQLRHILQAWIIIEGMKTVQKFYRKSVVCQLFTLSV